MLPTFGPKKIRGPNRIRGDACPAPASPRGPPRIPTPKASGPCRMAPSESAAEPRSSPPTAEPGRPADTRAANYEAALPVRAEVFEDNHRAVKGDRRMTVVDLFKAWLADRSDYRLSTARSHTNTLKVHVRRDPLAKVRLVDIVPEDINEWTRRVAKRRSMSGELLLPSTVLALRKSLSAAFGWGVDAGYLKANPARDAKGVKVPKRRIQPPTGEEVRMMLAEAEGTDLHPLLALAVYTGMRRGEALALTWGDLNLGERPTVHIHRTLDPKTREVMAYPKTRRSDRVLPLPPTVVLALRVRANTHAETKRAARVWLDPMPGGLVFSTREGRALDAKGRCGRDFKRVERESGAAAARQDRGVTAGLRWHDLRHYFATAALEAGVPLETVSKLLGHETLAITADLYGHLTPAMAYEAVDQVAAHIENGGRR